MANRFSQYVPGSNYAPESFKDLSVVPIALRQRHDNALAAQDDLLLQLNNIQVQPEFQDYYNQKREEITTKVNDLTNKINTIGAGDSNLLGEFRNMKRDYNKEVSLSGGLGRASNLKQTIDKTRANYMDFGVKQGWTPETTEKNFNQYYSNYMGAIDPNKIGDSNTIIQDFNPSFAPKQILPTEYLKNIQPLIGKISKEVAWSNFTPVQNPMTGEISFQQNSGATLSESNLERLKRVEDAINTEILNPDSGLRQSLRYSRPGVNEDEVVKQFLSESDIWIDVMGVEASKEVNQVEPPKFSKDSDSGGGRKAGSSDEPASLVSIPTGQEVFEGKSITDISNGTELKTFENTEKTRALTEEESAKKTQLILQQNRVNEALKQPSIIAEINRNIKNLTGSAITEKDLKNNISNAEKALQQITNGNYNNLNELGILVPSNMTEQSSATFRQSASSALLKRIADSKNILEEAYKTSIPTEDLKYSKLYKLGSGEAANKANKVMIESLNNYGINLVTYLDNAGGSFTNPGETELINKNEDGEIDNLKQIFSEGSTKITNFALVDMGSTGSSQLVVNYETGEAGKAKAGMLTIDYDNKTTDSAVIDNMLIETQKLLDPQGQATIQAILDNKQLKGLSVDSNEFRKTGFSPKQSETIKTMSKTVNSKYANSPEYKAVDYTRYPGRNLNMVLNTQGYYDLYMKDGKNDEPTPLGADAWFKKKFAKDYNDRLLNIADPTKAVELNDRKAFSREMLDFALLSSPDNLIQLDESSSKYQTLRQEYIEAINRNQNNITTQHELSVQFYNEIKLMKISHKNKKRLL